MIRTVSRWGHVLDARREDEFRLGRLPQALNILRFLKLEHRLAELPSGADVAAYLSQVPSFLRDRRAFERARLRGAPV